MSTFWIIALIAVVVIVVAAVLFIGPGRGGGARGRGLKGRFGPEYDRVVARHDGDTKAAERELNERVRRHGSLKPRPLGPEVREQYVARWAGVQEQFVDSPQHAVAEAGRLLGQLARDRGFPEPERFDDHVSALSVHHPRHVDGYRRLHRVSLGEGNTEQLREAMVDARALFEDLVSSHPVDHHGEHGRDGRHERNGGQGRHGGHDRHEGRHEHGGRERGHAPWSLGRRHAKES